MVKIQNPKPGQYTITLPLNLMKLKKWKKGTELIAIIDSNNDISLKEI